MYVLTMNSLMCLIIWTPHDEHKTVYVSMIIFPLFLLMLYYMVRTNKIYIKHFHSSDTLLLWLYAQQEFLQHGLLILLKNWLEPLPDGSLPNINIQSNILKLLADVSMIIFP